jgi:hypothetical protein
MKYINSYTFVCTIDSSPCSFQYIVRVSVVVTFWVQSRCMCVCARALVCMCVIMYVAAYCGIWVKTVGDTS